MGMSGRQIFFWLALSYKGLRVESKLGSKGGLGLACTELALCEGARPDRTNALAMRVCIVLSILGSNEKGA